MRGEGVVRSVPDAVVWYEWAARLGNVEAQFQLGLIFLHGEKPLLGPYRHETWRQSSAVRLGDKASNIHQLVFPHGTSVERDVDAAFRWISAAAERGKAEAQTVLGSMYSEGLGCEKDSQTAFAWYRGRGRTELRSQLEFALGDVYYQGKGVPVDFEQAAVWYRKAAEQGSCQGAGCACVHEFEGNGYAGGSRRSRASVPGCRQA